MTKDAPGFDDSKSSTSPLAQAPLTRESSKHPSVLAPRGSLRTGGGHLLGAVEAAAEAGEDGDEGDGVLRVVRQEEEAAGTSGGGVP